MAKTIDEVVMTTDIQTLLENSLSEWINILKKDCQVYYCQGTYLAKRFNEIQFSTCDKEMAKDILIDNLYALLKYKYFPQLTDEVYERIDRIVNAFTKNLHTSLISVTFDENESKVTGARLVKYLPDGCIAFGNGVFDFRKNDWLFKYNKKFAENISDTIFTYDESFSSYIITWYLKFDFEPWDIDITKMTSTEIINTFKSITEINRLFCFELIYNMCHDSGNVFSLNKFENLCEILGYTCLNSFSQYFVMLIGSGQNGKNSLFDGCFTNKLMPRPASIDLDTIENDRFVTGSLENTCHNLFLETDAKVHKQSKMLKQLTGSMYQSIERKGISRYSSIINCKYIFAGNDKNEIKFTDTTKGFTRRINLFEVTYSWDPEKSFMKTGDYYDTTFSQSLDELKSDVSNTITYVYLAMFGICLATSTFTKQFEFTKNEWSSAKYADVDIDLKNTISNLTLDNIFDYASKSKINEDEVASSLFSIDKHRIYACNRARVLGLTHIKKFIDGCKSSDGEYPLTYLFFNDEGEFYISLRLFQKLCGSLLPSTSFTKSIKRLYGITDFEFVYRNAPYLRVFVTADRHLMIKK